MKIPYTKLKDKLKTGDLILFSGQYKMSHEVEELEHSKWSHVAMVIRLPGYDEPLLYEATALVNLPDLLHHDTITGPKVVNLYERLKTYGQDVVPYKPPLYAARTLNRELPKEATEILENILNRLHGIPNPGTWQMIWEVIAGRYLNINTGMKYLTCSSFIAYTYEQLDLLNGHMPINGYMPKDFSTDGHLNLNDVYLSKEILIDLS